MTNPWDHAELIARVDRRAQQLRGVKAAALFAKKGIPKDSVAIRKETSPRLSTLERVASALEWTLPQLLGIEEPDKMADSLDDRRLRLAMRLVDDAIGLHKSPVDECADALAEAYRALLAIEAAAQANGGSSNGAGLSEDAFTAVSAMLRSRLGRKESSTS